MEKTAIETIEISNIYGQSYLESKQYYMYCFNSVPNLDYVMEIDGKKAYEGIRKKYTEMISSVHECNEWYRRKDSVLYQVIVVLNNECMINVTSHCVCVLYKKGNAAFAREAIEFVKKFRVRQKKKPLEINLVVRDFGGLSLRPMEVKRTGLNLDLFYNSDFKEVDETIKKRLNRNNDKGIVLLHGLPGTGKTSYLRYLIGQIKKRVLFLSSNLAGSLLDPEFIDLLIQNPHSVVIVEDAENIMMDRKTNCDSSVSNLLNISDGLLSDCLNTQLVCTFNSPLAMVDPALMRKGRLIARYEFGRLDIEKAQRLSDHLGFDKKITKPMTLAEISNPNDMEMTRVEVIGFKRHNEMMN